MNQSMVNNKETSSDGTPIVPHSITMVTREALGMVAIDIVIIDTMILYRKEKPLNKLYVNCVSSLKRTISTKSSLTF